MARLVDDTVVTESPVEAQAGPGVALIVHRLGFDCCFQAAGLNGTTRGGEFSVNQLFPDYFGDQVQTTSLTLLQRGPLIQKSFTIALKPMEIYTFELRP